MVLFRRPAPGKERKKEVTYYIADLHFGHSNILSFDNRMFPSIEVHDAELVTRWNEVVSPDDTVWILGDVSWYGPQRTTEILGELNGTKNLVTGNHDKRMIRSRDVRDCFAEIVPYKEIELEGGGGIVLCHYPIPCFNNHYYGWFHLYGHVHNSFEWNMMKHAKYQMEALYNTPCRMYNVGCMLPYMNYTPRTLAEIAEESEKNEEEEDETE